MDEWLNLPGLLTEHVEDLEIVDYNGNVIKSPQHRHCAGRNGYYESLESRFEAAGAMVRGKFGNANVQVLDAWKISAELGYTI